MNRALRRISTTPREHDGAVTWRALIILILGGIALGVVSEAGIALRWISMGTVPGAGPDGRGLVLAVAILALLIGAITLLSVAAVGSFPDRLLALFGPLSASFVVARFFSFDAYYLPTLRRMSSGIVPAEMVVAIVVLGVVAFATTLRFPRVGQVVTAITMLLSVGVAFFAGVGH